MVMLFSIISCSALSFGARGQSARETVGTGIALTVADLGNAILVKEAAEFRKRN
jgi:hypothetical protein